MGIEVGHGPGLGIRYMRAASLKTVL